MTMEVGTQGDAVDDKGVTVYKTRRIQRGCGEQQRVRQQHSGA